MQLGRFELDQVYNAEKNAKQFENAQVVRIDLREQIGTQEIFW